MALFTLRHFSNPNILKAIRTSLLLELLTPYRDYFAARGVELSPTLDFEALAGVLMAPDAQVPRRLIDDLYYLEDMSTPDGMDALLHAADEAGVDFDLLAGGTPAEVAVQFRARWPNLMERTHAEHSLAHRRRSFEYFQPHQPTAIAFSLPTASRLAEAEQELAGQLETLNRGRTCKLYAFPRSDGYWLLVRRGEPFKRDAAIEESGPASVYYRPERYDVIRYAPANGELAINAQGTKKLVALYRRALGRLLFGAEIHFAATTKYSLSPLITQAEAALACADIDGLDSVTLKEVLIQWGGPQGEVETRRARNLFAALRSRGKSLPPCRIARATFSVKFSGVRTPRAVTIREGNLATYARDEDALVLEEWLTKRGFITLPRKANEHAAPTLATG